MRPKNTKPMTTMQLRIETELHARLKEASNFLGRSMSDVIRFAVAKELDKLCREGAWNKKVQTRAEFAEYVEPPPKKKPKKYKRKPKEPAPPPPPPPVKTRKATLAGEDVSDLF